MCKQQGALHKVYQKLAAWTSLPLKEGKPVQSANLCLLCCHLHWHNTAVYLPGQKKLPGIGLPLPLDLDLDADADADC